MGTTFGKSIAVSAILFLIIAGFAAAQEDPTRIVLASQTLQPGESGVLDGRIDCTAADGCSAFAVQIVFDPVIIRVDTVEIGPYLGASPFVPENVIDNDAGTVDLAATALGELNLADDPVLFRLNITALAEGLSVLNIIELEVGDLVGNPLPAVGIAGAVVVSGGAPIESPLEIDPEKVIALVALPDDEQSLACQEYPSETAKSLTTIPSETTLKVLGRMGLEPETDEPPFGPPAIEELADHWLFARWEISDDSFAECWFPALALQVSYEEQSLSRLDDLMLLDETPYDHPGRVVAPQAAAQPCTIRTNRTDVDVRVGPGNQRGIRSALPANVTIPVVGQNTDSDGNLWWLIRPADFNPSEADRYWVAATDVVETGDCANVSGAAASQYVQAGDQVQASGSWGECGSCSTCGYAAKQCQLDPQGRCVWNPSLCDPNAVEVPDQTGASDGSPQCYTISGAGSVSVYPSPNCGTQYLRGTALTAWYVDSSTYNAIVQTCIAAGMTPMWSGCVNQVANETQPSVSFAATKNCVQQFVCN